MDAADLRVVISEEAFELYCQPIAAIGGLVRAYPMGEVLVRLREEEQANLPPGEFLPVLEHYGLMPQLDRFIVRHALGRLSIGSRIARLSFNLSSQTLAEHTFPAFVADALVNARVPGNCVLFEMEEAELMEGIEPAARFAALVGSLGVGMVIDGFGRTADAMQLLVELPCVRAVKLHGSHIRRLLSAGRPDALLERLLRETQRRGIMAVAESVEDPGAIPQLRSLGIRYAQGFGVYKPQPLESFIEPHALLVA